MAARKLGLEPVIHETAVVRDASLGRYTEIGARTSFVESTMGDYSYVVNDSNIIYTTIGKFCSIAAMTRINPGNHPMQRASQSHFTYRASAYFEDAEDDAAFFDWRRSTPVTIGHDVWIGHGALILPGARIGDGAIIGTRAQVVKDVPPYAVSPAIPAASCGCAFPPRPSPSCWRSAGGTGRPTRSPAISPRSQAPTSTRCVGPCRRNAMTTSATTPFTDDEIESARKLFEGPWDFVWASTHIDDLPPMVGQEIAFAGRSNVGKSSLINAVTRRNALARTSHTPGRTQQLNFFHHRLPIERLRLPRHTRG